MVIETGEQAVEDELIDEIFELPQAGLGSDFKNEVYREDSTTARVPLTSQKRDRDRVAEIPPDRSESGEDIRDVVNALRGLIQLLNSTEQGRKRLQKVKHKLYDVRPGSQGRNRPQVKDIILPVNQFLPNYKKAPVNDPVIFKKSPYGDNQTPVRNQEKSGTTIPPHLIPLGPDGRPLIRPNGRPVLGPNFDNNNLNKAFPYLATIPTTTVAPTTTLDPANNTDTKEDRKDMMTALIDTVKELPMTTRRHMLANMMMGVPMAALTMAAAGAPSLAIAPLAMVIPGFLFTAFLETDGHGHGGGGHGHGDEGHGHGDGGHGHGGGDHGDGDAATRDRPPRRGISGLISGLREFYSHNRDNQTLRIRTGPHSHGRRRKRRHLKDIITFN